MKPVHRVTAPVTLAGIGVLAWLIAHPGTIAPHAGTALLLLGPGVLIGELAPVRIPRRGDDEEITFSTTFTFALLLSAGMLPACGALVASSIVQDLKSRKPLWRVLFNVGQYTLSTAAAGLILLIFSGVPHLAGDGTFSTGDLPAIVIAGFAMFLVNSTIVGTAIALYQGMPIRTYLRRDFGFGASTGMVLQCMAPIVVAAMEFSRALVPLFVFPVLAVYQGSRQSAARAQHQAMHDALTGLPSRALLAKLVAEAADTAAREGSRFAVMLVDLDRFKEINDTLGHHHGDRLLREIGPRLTGLLRRGDAVARLSGDEFVVLARDLQGPEQAVILAERMGEALRAPFDVDDLTLEVDASIGIACFPEHGADMDELLKRADVAMYDAKNHHRGVAVYTPRRDPHSPARLALVPELRRAIGDGGLRLDYQPQVSISDSTITHVEALVRWQHPRVGLVSPADFIPLAEATGLIKPLTSWVLGAALHQVRAWSEQGIDLAVGINISARSLMDDGLPDEVAHALALAGVPADRLQLEITESSVMTDPEGAMSTLHRVAALGVGIAVDDFGTGYSSLIHLKELPVEALKVDCSFVQGMAHNRRDEVLVRSIIQLAHNLELTTVAEGVEGEDALAMLAGMGCHRVQGYLLSPPVAAERIPALVRASARPAPAQIAVS
jgi:diguanylate cyclase (GGDEF)-like protein